MIKRMIKKITEDVRFAEAIRYLIIGGCTTAVNFIAYTALTRLFAVELNAANVVAIIISILFAYVTNKVIVFKAKTKGFLQTVKEFSRFIGARLFTMALEIGGVWFFATKLGLYDLAVKAAVTVVVIIANYVLSKLLVFRKK